MANKKITDYQLIAAITGTVNFFVDDLTQNYRATAAQIKDFVLAAGNVGSTALADLSVTADKIASGAVTDGKTTFTAPTYTRLTSGSGTYTTPAGVKRLVIEMVGGGQGGSGGQSGNIGGSGGNTVFGSSLLQANGATDNSGTHYNARPGATAYTLNSPATLIRYVPGGSGQAGVQVGGQGGSSFFGSAGGGGYSGVGLGTPAAANTGSGGGGGGAVSGQNGGGGGGAGVYLKAQIVNPAASYSYSIATGGAGGAQGGAPGGSSAAGSAGGSGVIIIEEHYI